jgi:arylsulfatase A-like enzyme
MLTLLLASVVAGGLVCTIEWLFIVMTCGPFWMGPGIFFGTWLLYALFSFAGLFILNAVISLIPPLHRFLKSAGRKFFFYTSLVWIIATAMLIFLVANDFYAGSGHWTLTIIAVLLGFPATIFLIKTTRDRKAVLNRTLWSSAFFVVVSFLVLLAADLYHTRQLKARTAEFNNTIPHLCLLVLDTTRGDHLSCNGYEFNTTPNLDGLAAEGLNCTNAFSAANWTPPGHISIFTGKYPPQHGNNGQAYTPEELILLTEIVNQQGYYCVAIYNNPIAGSSINLTQGFDLDIGVWGTSWVYPAWMRLRNKFILRDNGSRATFPMAADVFDWVNKRGGHLFLYINVTEPHAPYLIHEPYFSEYSRKVDMTNIPDLNRVEYLRQTLELVIYDSTKFSGCTDDSYNYIRAAYDSEIAYMDEHIGVFVDRMQQTGLLDETLFVVTADHGEFIGEHWTMGHPELMYNPVLRIPLMIRYPRSVEPQVRDDYISNADIFPTVLNMMELAAFIPGDVEGIDVFSNIGEAGRLMLSARCDDRGGCYSLIQGETKLIFNHDDFLPRYFPFDTLLYDIFRDPGESVNLQSEQPDIRDTLMGQLNQWVGRIQVFSAGNIEIDEETKANLKALGYVH